MKSLHELLNLTRPLVGIDLETTGVKPKTSGICELALQIFAPGVAPTEYRTLVNPLLDIPASATAVHGITNEMVKDAPTFRQLAGDLACSLTDCDFVGYSVRFDLMQMFEEFQRTALDWTYEGARIIDGYRLWQCVEGRTLTDAIRRWGGDLADAQNNDQATDTHIDGKAHGALYDVKWSARVVAGQLSSGLLPLDLDELHLLQWPGWYDAQGKLRWNDKGVLCIGSWGEHKDKPIHTVPRSYLLGFMANPAKDFDPKVREAARDAAKGIPITRPGSVPEAPAADESPF
jgi:DNA polymerase III epsilon subunit-like protein